MHYTASEQKGARKQKGKSSDAFLVANAAKHPQLARQMPLADPISNACFSARMSHVACRITNAPGRTTFKSSLSKWPSELLAMQHVVSQPAQVRMSLRARINTTHTTCVSGRNRLLLRFTKSVSSPVPPVCPWTNKLCWVLLRATQATDHRIAVHNACIDQTDLTTWQCHAACLSQMLSRSYMCHCIQECGRLNEILSRQHSATLHPCPNHVTAGAKAFNRWLPVAIPRGSFLTSCGTAYVA